jgi:glutamate synthase domain-containing protein 3
MKMRVIVVEGDETSNAPKDVCCEYTLDGSVDIKGSPAVKGKSGGWLAGGLILRKYFVLNSADFTISFPAETGQQKMETKSMTGLSSEVFSQQCKSV